MPRSNFVDVQLARKRFKKRLRRKGIDHRPRDIFRSHDLFLEKTDREWARKMLGGEPTFSAILDRYLSAGIRYLLNTEESPLSWSRLKAITPWDLKVFPIPERFSLIDTPEESYEFLRQVLGRKLKDACRRFLRDGSCPGAWFSRGTSLHSRRPPAEQGMKIDPRELPELVVVSISDTRGRRRVRSRDQGNDARAREMQFLDRKAFR